MIPRSTVVYITILIALAGLYLYLNNRVQTAEPTATGEPSSEIGYLFTAGEGMPISIFIEAKSGESVEIARNAENAWAVTRPVEAAAEQGASEAAASQVAAMRVLDRVPQIDPGVVGLKQPEYTLKVRFSSGTERTANIGVVTPTESGYYVQDTAGDEIVIVAKSGVDALLRLLAAPPYLATSTP